MVVATVSMSWTASSSGGVADCSLMNSKPVMAKTKQVELDTNLDSNDDHHRCRRSSGRVNLLSSQAAVGKSSDPSESDSLQFVDNLTMDEATAALNNLMMESSMRPFVSSSPTKTNGDAGSSSKAASLAITNDELDLLAEWDLISPPSDDPSSPGDEGVVLNSLNSSVPCSDHQITSSSCSSAISSTPLSVSTASSTGHYMSASNDTYGSACKKRVRFADAHGKPLAIVCTFANSPVGSYDSANNTPVATTLSRIFNLVQAPSHRDGGASSMDTDCMELLFPDPLSSYSALTERLRTQNIALESVCCRSGYIRGMIRVRNLSFSKNVFVRITFDGWASSNDWSADYFPIISPSDGRTEYDLFEFSVPIPPNLMPGTIVDFAACYRCGDRPGEFWDSNGGRNYSLRYRPLSSMVASSMRRQPPCTTANNMYNSYTRTAAELEAERAQRIREFVWSEFASWNGGSALVANRSTMVSSAPISMRTSVATAVSTTTTSPAGKDMPYW